MSEALAAILKRMRAESNNPEDFAFRVLNTFPASAESIAALQERNSMQLAALLRYLYEEDVLSVEQVEGALFEMARSQGI